MIIDRQSDFSGLQGVAAPPQSAGMHDAWRGLPPAAAIFRRLKDQYRFDPRLHRIASCGAK
jgi:hypothetical protein